MAEEANFAHYCQQPTEADSATASANPALKYSSDADPFEMAAEGRPSSPNFVLYCATDGGASGDGDGAGDAVKRSLTGPSWDCRGAGMCLY